MARLKFGGFLAPHHPIGENPMLQLRRDIDLVAHLDKLGYDEFWCGEHHSSGWEVIASPELDMVARYVIPEINGYMEGLKTSRKFVAENREYFDRAKEAVMAKILDNEKAAAALAITKSPLLAASSSNVPDFDKARPAKK